MNDLELYKIAFTPIYKRLTTHYQSLFYKGAKEDRAKHLLLWLQTIEKAKLPIDDLDEFTEFLLNKSNAYSKFAPNPGEYVTAFKEWYSLRAESCNEMTESFKEQFERVYKNLSLRYESLWARNEVGTIEAHSAFWRDEIYNSGISESSLMPAVDRIRKMGQFRIYPPNVDQFIDVAKIADREDKVPAVEEAFELATSSRDGTKFHPLLRYVRSKFGYLTLVDSTKYGIKAQFEGAYREALSDFIDGRLDLKKGGFGEEESQADSSASPEKIKSTLDDILARLSA